MGNNITMNMFRVCPFERYKAMSGMALLAARQHLLGKRN
jgi:hypothetical protein